MIPTEKESSSSQLTSVKTMDFEPSPSQILRTPKAKMHAIKISEIHPKLKPYELTDQQITDLFGDRENYQEERVFITQSVGEEEREEELLAWNRALSDRHSKNNIK